MSRPKYPDVTLIVGSRSAHANAHGIIRAVTERIRESVGDAAAEEYKQHALEALKTATYEEVLEFAKSYINLSLR